MKKLCKIIFILILTIIFISFGDSVIKGDSRVELLSSYSEEECLEFLIEQGVEIPDSFVNKNQLKIFVKKIIEKVELNPQYQFLYNNKDTLELAENIKLVVNQYYGCLNTSIIYDSIQINNRDALENSMVLHNGIWNYTQCDWNSRWGGFNCYAYAINRHEDPYQYTNVYYKYQPGDFSNSGFEFLAGTTTVYDVADAVYDDLESLGMTDIDITYSIPADIGDDERLIALRVGPVDYHFMQYDKDTDEWYHKPSIYAVMKYIREMTTSWIWIGEGMDGANNIHRDLDLYYDSAIAFITYTPPSFTLTDDITATTLPLALTSGRDYIYDVKVEDDAYYKISSKSSYSLDVYFYDENMEPISMVTPVYIQNGCESVIMTFLEEGNYFYRIRFVNSLSAGNIFTTIDCGLYTCYEISLGSNNVLNRLYQNEDDNYEAHLMFPVTSNEGMYELTLSAYYGGYNLNTTNYIKVYDNYNRIVPCSKYQMINNSSLAYTLSTKIVMYFDEYTTYYIDICLPNHNYTSLYLNIMKVDDYIVNLFNLSESSNTTLIDESNIPFSDYFFGLDLKQAGKLRVGINGTQNGTFVLLKKIDNGDSYYYTVLYFNSLYTNYNYSFNLIEGYYYIGYINATSPSFTLKRIITYYGGSNLLPDHPSYELPGTEVTLNNGAYNSNVLTQGFTRLIYLANNDSRLDYYWYSNNENVAIVTAYGTIIGLNVTIDTSVYIMAVNKEDSSITYVKEFIIKKETKTYSTDPLNYYLNMFMNTGVSNMVQINLNNLNVPYNYLQFYNWVSSSELVEVDSFGRIIVDENGDHDVYFITGYYLYNDRVRINIVLSVGE